MNVSKLRIGEICYSKDLNTEHICDMEKTCSPQAGRGVKVSERCLIKKLEDCSKVVEMRTKICRNYWIWTHCVKDHDKSKVFMQRMTSYIRIFKLNFRIV